MDLGTAQKLTSRWASGSAYCYRGRRRPSPSRPGRFGTADNLAGATLAAFDIPTAQQLLGEVGRFDDINVVAKPGADKATVGAHIARVCRVALRW